VITDTSVSLPIPPYIKIHSLFVVMLWNGCECGKNYGNENPKAIAPVQIMIYLKTTGERRIFQLFG